MRNKKAPKSMLDLHLDVEGDTHVKVSLTRTPEFTSFRLATAESGHQSLPADLKHVDDIPADEPERRMSKLEIVTLTKVSKNRYHSLLKSGGLGTVHEEHRAATGTPRKVVDRGVCLWFALRTTLRGGFLSLPGSFRGCYPSVGCVA